MSDRKQIQIPNVDMEKTIRGVEVGVTPTVPVRIIIS